MPEVRVEIGGRDFDVACQEGEEHFLKSAAKMLDTEATELTRQIGRIPEARMLLMAGLMLADKTAGLEEELKNLGEKLATQETLIEEMNTSTGGRSAKAAAPSEAALRSLTALAARAEAVADQVEKKLAAAG